MTAIYIHDTVDDDPPTVAVLDAIAAVSNQNVMELEPLSNTVDPDALNTVVRDDARVEFQHEGYSVTVGPDRVVIDRDGH